MKFDNEKKQEAFDRLDEIFHFTGERLYNGDDIIHDIAHYETKIKNLYVTNGTFNSENLDSKELFMVWMYFYTENNGQKRKHQKSILMSYDFIIDQSLESLTYYTDSALRI